MKSSNSYVKRSPDCAFRVIDNEALVVKVSVEGESKVYSLNETGTAIWNLADGRLSLSQIADQIRNSFDIRDDNQLAEDLDTFTKDLLQRNMIQVKESSF